jgi:RecA-family ATPase
LAKNLIKCKAKTVKIKEEQNMDREHLIRKARAYEKHLGIQPNDMRNIPDNDLQDYVNGLREDYLANAMANRIIRQIKK